LFQTVKKERNRQNKKYNYDGGFFARYLQNIDNDILMLVVKGLQEKGFVVGSLIFDGCLVEKNEALDKEFPELEKLILEKTGYPIKIITKPLETDWKP